MFTCLTPMPDHGNSTALLLPQQPPQHAFVYMTLCKILARARSGCLWSQGENSSRGAELKPCWNRALQRLQEHDLDLSALNLRGKKYRSCHSFL